MAKFLGMQKARNLWVLRTPQNNKEVGEIVLTMFVSAAKINQSSIVPAFD